MPDYSQPTSPRLGDAYDSKDSITGSIDKTAQETAYKQVKSGIVYSSLAVADLSEAGGIFFATVENAFYGIKVDGNSTLASSLGI